MKLVKYGLQFLFNIFIRRFTVGKALYVFSKNMGIAYIKLAQILSMWNIDNIFSEQDREDIKDICDACTPIHIENIRELLYKSYGGKPKFIKQIYRKPIGSASVSQVHKAVLISGELVVLKIKRKDVEANILRDIKTIRWLIHHFGFIFGFTNKTGSTVALQMYNDWIASEVDFNNEVQNIIKYTRFANSVNGKISDCKRIVLPKVYTEYCTSDIIVMEYIPHKTINSSDTYTSAQIRNALDSYIKLSIYALLHRQPVVFHGDPHMGNLYLDNHGNLGFLDMGLVFSFSQNEKQLIL